MSTKSRQHKSGLLFASQMHLEGLAHGLEHVVLSIMILENMLRPMLSHEQVWQWFE